MLQRQLSKKKFSSSQVIELMYEVGCYTPGNDISAYKYTIAIERHWLENYQSIHVNKQIKPFRVLIYHPIVVTCSAE